MSEMNELRERDPGRGGTPKTDVPVNGTAPPTENKPALDGVVMRPDGDSSEDEDLGKVTLKRQVGKR